MDTKASEADIVAQNTKLITDLASAIAERDTVRGQVSALTGENTTLRADKSILTTNLATANASISTITSERDASKAEATKLTTDRDDWKAKAEPIQKQLAIQLANHGIRKEAISAATDNKSGENGTLSLTQQCMATKGLPADAEFKVSPGMIG